MARRINQDRQFRDQMGSFCHLKDVPQRIVSLVPSQTELLFDLGLNDKIVGITKFCIHPYALTRQKVKIGGTKKFRFDIIDKLRPDLIIGNKEENYQEGIEILRQKYPVWMSDINDLNDAFNMMKSIGSMLDKNMEVDSLIMQIAGGMNEVKSKFQGSVAYFIWKDPLMVVASNNFIHNILVEMGFTNVFEHRTRYPEISHQQLSGLNPDYILLSSEPFPFKAKHFEEFQRMCPDSKVCIVDGEMFSWYGSRLLRAVNYFKNEFPQIIR